MTGIIMDPMIARRMGARSRARGFVLRQLPCRLGNMGRLVLQGGPTEENFMPKMSDSRRKRIQAKQRKATSALQRAAKVAKRKRNSAKTGTAAG